MIRLYWWNDNGLGKDNWGDILNPILVGLLSKDSVIYDKDNPDYIVIGSILEHPIKKPVSIWGTGFISEHGKLLFQPKNIYAVRGPLTYKKLCELGISAPTVFGDPALLFSEFYWPKIVKKYEIGVIPHYIDKEFFNLALFNDMRIRKIDINSGIYEVINSILECKFILSSSLHGIIAAHSYGISARWIKFSERVAGNGFKFRDYFLSVQHNYKEPFVINSNTTYDQLCDLYYEKPIEIDLNKLKVACPFRNE